MARFKSDARQLSVWAGEKRIRLPFFETGEYATDCPVEIAALASCRGVEWVDPPSPDSDPVGEASPPSNKATGRNRNKGAGA